MLNKKLLLALVLGFFCTAVTTQAATFDWVRGDIDVYDLKVISVKRGQLRAHISGVGTRTFSVPSNFRFQIDGQATPLSGLVPNQRLRAYVTRTSGGKMQLVDVGPVKSTVPAEPPKTPVIAEVIPAPEAAYLPKTGSVFPLTLGVALASGIMALALRRRRVRS